MKLSRMFAVALSSVALAVGLGVQPAAVAADNPFERGPAPTHASIEAMQGPYSTSTRTIPRSAARGFGGGTIHFPTSAVDGKFGVVAVSPGFFGTQTTIKWLGPRIASQGFVVVTIDTITPLDQPGSRGDQLLAALDHAIADPVVSSRIDRNRQAVMGHSMGGGGALEAAKDRRSLRATVGLTPWNADKTWPEVQAASLVVGAQNDGIAPISSHAIPLFSGLTNAERRAYLELRGASHFAPNWNNTPIAKYSISWLKRYVDDDTRYTQFISPGPVPGVANGISRYVIN